MTRKKWKRIQMGCQKRHHRGESNGCPPVFVYNREP